MKIVLWGAGAFGQRILSRIHDRVVAIIDCNKNKVGTEIKEIPVISYEEYERSYADYYILITTLINNEIVSFLNKKKNYKYFKATDLPGEWFDDNERKGYKEYLYSQIDKITDTLIYGCNYHAILMQEVIKERIGKHVSLVANKSVNINVIQERKKIAGEIISVEEAKNRNWKSVLVATGGDLEELEGFPQDKIETWDCKDIIKEYRHPELERYKDIHKGERCFVIGNGPSLNPEDLTTLKKNNEICFGVNSIYDIYEETAWRPDYYVTGDIAWLSTGEFTDNVRTEDYKAVFVTDRMKEEFYKERTFEVIHLQASVPSEVPAKFSRNLVTGAYYSATVLYICLQIAVYMGFSEIYLLGVDFTGGKSGRKTKYKHFDGEYDGGFLYNQIIYQGYMAAKREEEKGGFRIYNATRGGELDIFERVDFDDLFS